jgi:hypothetical protein
MSDRIHHNLHTGKVSVRKHGETRITLNADWVEVTCAVASVQAGGRRACVKRATENGSIDSARPKGRAVHAFILGTVVDSGDGPRSMVGFTRRVRYNPFRRDDFHTDDGKSWLGSDRVVVADGYVWSK